MNPLGPQDGLEKHTNDETSEKESIRIPTE